MASKLAVILGCTSGQGRSVVGALLKSKDYIVRGVARDTTSEEAQKWIKRGVEVVEGDLSDPVSLKTAFQDANIIFAVTKMVDGDTESETQQGRNIVDVAATLPELQTLIWSTLPSAITVSDGQLAVPHMDGKAKVDEYIIQTQPLLARKTQFLWGGFYAENVLYPNYTFNPIQSAGNHNVWIQPVSEDTLVPMVGDHNKNIGIVVRRMLDRPDTCPPMSYVLAVTDWLAHGEYLRMWTSLLREVHGRTIDATYVKATLEVVGTLWPQLGGEMGLMLKFLEVYGKNAWSKKGAKIVSIEDLGLTMGPGENELVNTAAALRILVEKEVF